MNFYNSISKILNKIHIGYILALALIIRISGILIGLGYSNLAIWDQIGALSKAFTLSYVSQAMFGKSYLPGPYQNLLLLLLYKLSKIFYKQETVKLIYFFMVFYQILFIYFDFLLVKKIFNKEIALINAIILAILPFPVKYSTSYWNPYMIPFLYTLIVYILYIIIEQDRSKLIFFIPLLFAFSTFFHFIIFYTIPVYLIIYIYFKPKINIKYFIFGIISGLFLYTYFLYYDYINKFIIIKGYFKAVKSRGFEFESFKTFTDLIFVTTIEISRIIGHTFKEYKFFLQKSFGKFYYWSFVFYLISFYFSLHGFYIWFFRNKIIKKLCKFKDDNFIKKYNSNNTTIKKNINKNLKLNKENKNDNKNYKINIKSFNFTTQTEDKKIKNFKDKIFFVNIATFIPQLFFFLTFKAHFFRYTVISFPLLFLPISFSILYHLKHFKVKNRIYNYFNFLLIVIFIISTIYINFAFFFYSKNPNTNKKVRIIPSMIYYEDLYYTLLNNFKNQTIYISMETLDKNINYSNEKFKYYRIYNFFKTLNIYRKKHSLSIIKFSKKNYNILIYLYPEKISFQKESNLKIKFLKKIYNTYIYYSFNNK